jgi:hypothetical protein
MKQKKITNHLRLYCLMLCGLGISATVSADITTFTLPGYPPNSVAPTGTAAQKAAVLEESGTITSISNIVALNVFTVGEDSDAPNFDTSSPHYFGNFHLLSTSPNINQGSYNIGTNGAKDLAGHPRLYGLEVDNGAFEYGNLIVDLPDFTIVPNSGNTSAQKSPVAGAGLALYNNIVWGNIFNDQDLFSIGSENQNIFGDDDPLFNTSSPHRFGFFHLTKESPALTYGTETNTDYIREMQVTTLDNEKDLSGYSRLYGTSVNLGAYEDYFINVSVGSSLPPNYTITENIAAQKSPVIQAGTLTLYNNIVWGNIFNDQNFSGIDYLSAPNIFGNEDPLFAEPIVTTEDIGAHFADFRLQEDVSTDALDLGNNDDYHTALGFELSKWNRERDLGGAKRRFNVYVDLGAYELPTPVLPRAVWTGASDNDWQNPDNWFCIGENKLQVLDYIPDYYSDVWIPGDAANYPDLQNEVNECDDIYFIQGAEIGQQQYLTYNRAHVQLNFGLKNTTQSTLADFADIADDGTTGTSGFTATHLQFSAEKSGSTLGRSRWYMLSPAIQKVVSGDYSFGDHPRVFMRKFNNVTASADERPVGQWTLTFGDGSSPLNPMEGFSLWVNDYQDQYGYRESGSGDAIASDATITTSTTYGLKQQNGILELPFHENAEMSAAGRTHRLNGNTSEFYYIWSNGANAEKIDPTDYVTADRGEHDAAYRLLGEEYNSTTGAWEWNSDLLRYDISAISGTNTLLIGNPSLSSIDFVKFLADNSTVIEKNYRLWDGTQFFTAAVDETDIVTVGGSANVDAGYIAPMQSFFVTLKDVADRAGATKLIFDVTKNAVRSAQTLRSDAVEENIIRIQAQNNDFTSETLIAKRENANDGYTASEDVYKLFSQKLNVPEVYSVADRYALAMNFIQGESELTIPLGLKTNKLGATKLTLSGMTNYAADKIEFIDVAANQTIDVTNNDSYEYTFDNQTKGVQEGKFYLRILHSTTGIHTPEVKNLYVTRNQDAINVVATSTNPIRQIDIYDLLGRKLYGNHSVNSDLHIVPDRWTNEKVLVVKVITEQGVQSVKLTK